VLADYRPSPSTELSEIGFVVPDLAGDTFEHLDEQDIPEEFYEELDAGRPEPAPVQADRARGRSAAPATPGRGRAPGSESKASPKLRKLMSRVATHDPAMAQMLARCDVSFPSGKVTITPPDRDTYLALTVAQAQQILREATRHVGSTRFTVERV
jgi:hypothetical protein